MTEAERRAVRDLAIIAAKVDQIHSWMEKLDKTVHGNGTPGLKQRLAEVEFAQRQCPAKEAYTRTNRIQVLSVAIAGVSALTAVGGVLFLFIR